MLHLYFTPISLMILCSISFTFQLFCCHDPPDRESYWIGVGMDGHCFLLDGEGLIYFHENSLCWLNVTSLPCDIDEQDVLFGLFIAEVQ